MDQNDQSVSIEIEERIEKISSVIAALRSVIGEGKAERQLIDEVFRKVHSLKASAQTQGLDDLTNLANRFETVLHSIRIGQTRLDEAALTTFDSLTEDLFATLKVSKSAGRAVGEDHLSQVEAQSNEVNVPPLSYEIWQSLNQEEKHKVQTLIAEGSKLFVISTSFDVGDFDRRFQDFKDELNNNGEVISIAPTVEADQPDKIVFKILYATAAGLEGVKSELASFDRLAIKAVGPRSPNVQLALEKIVLAGEMVAQSTGKEIDFQVHGFDILFDQPLLDGISDSLVHLVRNAVDHGIEPADERIRHGKSARGTVVIKAAASEDLTLIGVIDDGRGMDPKTVDMIFKPGFTTANTVSQTSGRGVGLDVVENEIKRRGGKIRVVSKPGGGTSFEIRLPVTFRQD